MLRTLNLCLVVVNAIAFAVNAIAIAAGLPGVLLHCVWGAISAVLFVMSFVELRAGR